MSSSINYTTIAALSGDNTKGVSLCIPRVFNNIGWRRIKRVFIALNWGYVDRVDVIPSGGTKRAFVHFTPGKFNATNVLEALCVGQNVKIVYDDPWFWNISLSRSPKPDEAPKPPQRPEVQISKAPALTRQSNADATGLSILSLVGAAELAGRMSEAEYDSSLQPNEEQRAPSDD